MASPIVNKVLDRMEGEKSLNILESNFDTSRPKLWARAKELAEERYGVYGVKAHSWAYKWYEQKGGIFENKECCKECGSYEHKTKDCPQLKKESVEEAATTRIPAQNGNVYELMYSWRGKTYFCKMFFPQPGKPSKKEVQTALNQVYPSAILRNCVISAVNYGDPYIHAGKGDGFTGNATGY